MDITGTLKKKFDEQQIKETFKKREFVLTDDSSQYPQHILFELTQDRCSLIDNYKEGDQIKVHFNLRGREYTNPQGQIKYFNSIQAWRIESANGGSNSSAKSSNVSNTSLNDAPQETFSQKSPTDDLPF